MAKASVVPAEGTLARRQFLVHIDADLIRRTKILAIERGVTASSLVQQAVADFLLRHGALPPSAAHSEDKP